MAAKLWAYPNPRNSNPKPKPYVACCSPKGASKGFAKVLQSVGSGSLQRFTLTIL